MERSRQERTFDLNRFNYIQRVLVGVCGCVHACVCVHYMCACARARAWVHGVHVHMRLCVHVRKSQQRLLRCE